MLQSTTTIGDARSGLREWRDSYPVVVTSFFGSGIAVLANWSIGLFLEPMQKDLGWGRGQISGALVVVSVIAFFAAPFAGRLIDRVGTRRVGLPGMAIYCAAIAALGATGTQLWQWWAMWLLVAVGYVLIKPTLWAAAISQRFDVQRGLALAVMMCGSGVLLVFMPVVLTRLIADYGWRMTYVFLGLGSAVLTLPLMALFLHDRPPTAAAREAKAAVGTAVERSEMWNALLSGRFIRLMIAGILLTIAIVGLQVHYVPLIVAAGGARSAAALMAGTIGIGSIVGRLTCGFLLDRWRGQIVGGMFFALPAVSSLFLIGYHGGGIAGYGMAFVQGLALGAEIDVLAFLVGRYFGLRHYGVLMGTVVGGLALGSGIGPTLAGAIFDATGGYRLFIILTIPAFLASAALVASLGDYDARRMA